MPRIRGTFWANLLGAAFIGGAAVGSAWLLFLGVDSLDSMLRGHTGTLTATTCEPFAKASTCTGDFVSDDGTVRISGVTFFPPVKQWPMDPVEAVVSGPSASRAHTDTDWWIRAGAGVAFALFASYGFRELFWDTDRYWAKWGRLAIGCAAIVIPVSAWTILT